MGAQDSSELLPQPRGCAGQHTAAPDIVLVSMLPGLLGHAATVAASASALALGELARSPRLRYSAAVSSSSVSSSACVTAVASGKR